jgi:hypothetical protein
MRRLLAWVRAAVAAWRDHGDPNHEFWDERL